MYTSPHTSLRLATYDKTFGLRCTTREFHSPDNRIPHVDVYVYPPNALHAEWVYVTDGVSDRRMAVPQDMVEAGAPSRMEFVGCSDQFNPSVPSFLKAMIDHVFSKRSFLNLFHTYSGKRPGLKFREALVSPLLVPAAAGFEPFTIEGDEVEMSTVLPLTHREYKLAVARGPELMFAALMNAGASPSFDSNRKSVV